MRLKATRRVVGDVWLDSDNLTDMSLLLLYVQQAKICLALCTEQLLLRPWCVGELTTAYLHNTCTVLVQFPGFRFFDDRTIESFDSVVPDIGKLVVHGIKLQDVQSMLAWFPGNEQILLDTPLHQNSVSNLASKLVTVQRSMVERDAQQVSFSSVHASKLAIVADTSRTEALANAWIISTLLSQINALDPTKVPEVVLEGAMLQSRVQKVIVLCSENCFHTPHMVENLVAGAQLSVQSLPVITEEDFRFPSEAFFEDLEQNGLPNSTFKIAVVVSIIRSVFQEIAIVVKPADYSTTEAILAVRASEIDRRLDGPLSVLDGGDDLQSLPAAFAAPKKQPSFTKMSRSISKNVIGHISSKDKEAPAKERCDSDASTHPQEEPPELPAPLDHSVSQDSIPHNPNLQTRVPVQAEAQAEAEAGAQTEAEAEAEAEAQTEAEAEAEAEAKAEAEIEVAAESQPQTQKALLSAAPAPQRNLVSI